MSFLKMVQGFSKTLIPFSDLNKALKCFGDPQKLKVCVSSNNSKSDTALFDSWDFVKETFGKKFRCNKCGHIKKSCKVKQGSICKKFGQCDYKCFQKSKLDEKSEKLLEFFAELWGLNLVWFWCFKESKNYFGFWSSRAMSRAGGWGGGLYVLR